MQKEKEEHQRTHLTRIEEINHQHNENCKHLENEKQQYGQMVSQKYQIELNELRTRIGIIEKERAEHQRTHETRVSEMNHQHTKECESIH